MEYIKMHNLGLFAPVELAVYHIGFSHRFVPHDYDGWLEDFFTGNIKKALQREGLLCI